MSDIPYYTNLTITNQEHSQILIEGEIPVERAELYRARAITHLGKHAKLDGFRPGKIPESVLLSHIGETGVWGEIAELALSEAYQKIVDEQKLRLIGRANISITKLAPGNPIGFSISASVLPEVTLPDVMALSKDALSKITDTEEVTEKDIEEAKQTMRRNHAHAKWHTDHPDDHSHTHNIQDADLPQIDDAFVKSLGAFETVDQFTEALKRQLASEKKHALIEKRRNTIAEALIEKVSFPVPKSLTDSELSKMVHEFETSIGRGGYNVEEYLQHAGKTLDGIKEEWRPEAERRGKLQIIVAKIAESKGLRPAPEKIDREVAHIIEHYPDADQANVTAYVENMLTTQMVFEHLEKREAKS